MTAMKFSNVLHHTYIIFTECGTLVHATDTMFTINISDNIHLLCCFLYAVVHFIFSLHINTYIHITHTLLPIEFTLIR